MPERVETNQNPAVQSDSILDLLIIEDQQKAQDFFDSVGFAQDQKISNPVKFESVFKRTKDFISENRDMYFAVVQAINSRAQQLQAACCPPTEIKSLNISATPASFEVSFIKVDSLLKTDSDHKHCSNCGGEFDSEGNCPACKKAA